MLYPREYPDVANIATFGLYIIIINFIAEAVKKHQISGVFTHISASKLTTLPHHIVLKPCKLLYLGFFSSLPCAQEALACFQDMSLLGRMSGYYE